MSTVFCPFLVLKGELQILRRCLKKSTVNVAALQGLIAGSLAHGDKQHCSAKNEYQTTGDTTSCNVVTGGTSHGSPQWRGGACAFEPMVKFQGTINRRHPTTTDVKLPQDLQVADSGIDSSDTERNGATLEVTSGPSTLSSDEELKCNASVDTSELCNPTLPAKELRDNHQSDDCIDQSCTLIDLESLAETSSGRTCEEAGRCSPPSSSTEDEDLPTRKRMLNTRQRNPRHFRCGSTEKRPIKQWHKTEKLRDVTSLQRTIERLERTVQLMKAEIREMEKNYGEALVQRDSALRMIRRMECERETEQERRRKRECTNGKLSYSIYRFSTLTFISPTLSLLDKKQEKIYLTFILESHKYCFGSLTTKQMK